MDNDGFIIKIKKKNGLTPEEKDIEFEKNVNKIWFNVMEPYVRSNKNSILKGLENDDTLVFQSFMKLYSPVYDDIYYDIHESKYDLEDIDD